MNPTLLELLPDSNSEISFALLWSSPDEIWEINGALKDFL